MIDQDHSTTRIAGARKGLADKLGELQRRAARMRTALAPLGYLSNPWLRACVGIGVGYVLGRGRVPQLTGIVSPQPQRPLARAIVRSTLLMIAESVIRRALAPRTES